jgi:predicted Ser/Thr protein kinase
MDEVENFPKNIGRYEIKGLLGSGAMGSVYLAEDPRIKRKLAIKVVKLNAIGSEKERKEFLARFQREAEVSGVLNDPGIVTIYDVGDSDVGPFLAMEYVPGRTLDALMKGGPALTLKEKLAIAVGIAAALDHAHDKGIVHRDVKPGNVMITEDTRPKLMDFGIAKREDASLTQTGTFLGTPSYASPEQIREGIAAAASDVFSFGVLTFELLSGSLPFPGTSINTILYKIVNEPPVEIKPPVDGLMPDAWQRVFTKVLAKDPADRHATCSAFVKDLLDGAKDLGRTDRMHLLGNLRSEHVAGTQRRASDQGEHPEIQSLSTPVRGKGGRGALYAVVAAAVVATGVGGAFLFRKGATTQVLVDTLPTGAKALKAGRELGVTPLPVPLKAGEVLQLEKKGYHSLEYRFQGGDAAPKVTLEALHSDETIRTYPEGATVVLDTVKLEGLTPLTVKGWDQSMKHDLTCTKGDLGVATTFNEGETPGSQVFTLVPASQTRAGAQPKAVDANAPGTLRFAAPYSVHVKLDGRDLGEVREGGSLSAPPGNHKLELSNARVFLKENQTVTVAPGQPVTVTLPGLCHLTVNTFPNSGTVVVDGIASQAESDGVTPIQLVKGHHSVGVQGRPARAVELTGDFMLKMPY